MGWLDTADDRFADAVAVLATATHRPVRLAVHDGAQVVRVDFEFGRYILARTTESGPGADPDADGSWIVSVHDEGVSTRTVAEAMHEWLADAFDLVADAVRAEPRPPRPCPVVVLPSTGAAIASAAVR